jgi:protein-S-isoprenylcysteine O-methyltransferase Ste14
MNELHERPAHIPWPPIIYIGAVALAIVLGFVIPTPWIWGPLADFLFAIGALIAGGGIAIVVMAIRSLAMAKTTASPVKGAEHLVTDGPYAFSRNPIYLGNTMVMLGLWLFAGNLWFLVLAIVAAFLTQKLAIEPEEKHLDLRFGRRYRDYAKNARRWF